MQLKIPCAKLFLFIINSLITSLGFLSPFAFTEVSYSFLKLLKLSFNFLIKQPSKKSTNSFNILFFEYFICISSSSIEINLINSSWSSPISIDLIQGYILHMSFCLTSFDSLSLYISFMSLLFKE